MIIDLMHSGCSLQEVSGALGIGKTSVSNIYQKYLKGTLLKNRYSPGRRRILTKRDEKGILVSIKRNPFLSAKELLESIPDYKKVSAGTIRRILRSVRCY